MLKPDLKTRAYIYRVLAAASPLATVYGIANAATVALWLGLAGTVLGLGLAVANTTPPKTRNDDGSVNLSPVLVVMAAVLIAIVILSLVGHPVHVR